KKPDLGLGTMLHWLPSQWIVNVYCGPQKHQYSPSAHTSLEAMAATANRPDSMSRLGLGTMLHWLPSQCSVKVWLSKPNNHVPTDHISLGATTAPASSWFG